MKQQVEQRSGNACELCGEKENLSVYEVPPNEGMQADRALMLCSNCFAQVDKKAPADVKYWQKILPETMWSEIPAVQVVSWRMLNRLRNESWAAELLEMMYPEETILTWAKATGDHESDGSLQLHMDANGALLQNGDTVILTKSLDVKGATIHARLGTVVKNIRLVADNHEQIEGKVEGQLIVILTKYLRKQTEKN